MPKVELLQVSDKEIIFVDYSGCKPEQMIEVFNQAKEIVLTKTEGCLLLTNFEHSYISPTFMRHAEREMPLVKHLIKKNAFIGMTLPQRMILKGFRSFIGEDDYISFDNREEAIEYLVR
ncbi:MAG: hypothetical protein JST48_12555 [Bacteroidetes bacterium]|nr:hypothetical protein [Bacteroidota bacterium]